MLAGRQCEFPAAAALSDGKQYGGSCQTVFRTFITAAFATIRGQVTAAANWAAASAAGFKDEQLCSCHSYDTLLASHFQICTANHKVLPMASELSGIES